MTVSSKELMPMTEFKKRKTAGQDSSAAGPVSPPPSATLPAQRLGAPVMHKERLLREEGPCANSGLWFKGRELPRDAAAGLQTAQPRPNRRNRRQRKNAQRAQIAAAPIKPGPAANRDAAPADGQPIVALSGYDAQTQRSEPIAFNSSLAFSLLRVLL